MFVKVNKVKLIVEFSNFVPIETQCASFITTYELLI